MVARAGARLELASQDGFTLIELMVALLVLTVGIFAVATTFDFSRASTNQSELRTTAVDRIQREVEAVRSLPYEQAAHPTGGILATSADPKDPTSRISGSNFGWDPAHPAASEPLVTSANGTVPMKQVIAKGEDDRFGYTIWRFVTRTAEPACSAGLTCEAGGNQYRRITVVVRAEGLGGALDPVWSSTTVIDPARAANNDGQPQTLCQNEEGTALELCSAAADGDPLELYLTDTPANSGNSRQQIPADPAQRKLHKTVKVPASCTAGSSSGCPVPDLMVADPLPILDAEDPVPPLVSFATDVTPTVDAGRPLVQDAVACGGTPSKTDDLKGAYWVSPPLAEPTKLTGHGAMRLYGHSWTGAEHNVDLCGVVYDVPATIANPVAQPPREIGDFYSDYDWPATPQPINVDVHLGVPHGWTVAAGRRIGVRLWVSGSSGDDVVLIYGQDNHESGLTLLTEEEDE
jgi:prepilin-type N-terminal cleavage/methylation domain-containing protein